MSNNQLSSYQTFNTENLIFSKPEVGSIPGQKINFKRIRIAVRNPDNSIGDLILSTPDHLHSFGLQETRDPATNILNGYVMPLCLWNRNGCTEKEKQFTETFNRITDYCKEYLLQHKEDIEKYDLDMSDLKKFNPLFWKMEKGKIVEGRGPMLYCKVLHNKKQDKITTIFVDEESNQEIDPFTVLNKPCSVTAAVKFESIFIGNKISLQVKLYEVVVRPQDKSVRGLLRPNASRPTVSSTPVPTLQPVEVNIYNHLADAEESEEEEEIVSREEDENSILGEDEERGEELVVVPEPIPVAPEPPKKATKPRGKKSG
ncbi:DUF2738 domain-containing protein [bacterium]|nr:DUF2738 domain-containing protein [bacterium]